MKRWFLYSLTLVVLLAAGYYVWTAYLRRPSLVAEQVEAVEISLHDQMGKQTQHLYRKDRAQITSLVELLRTGKPTSDHKCGDSGTITLEQFGDGSKKLGLLAGHHAKYYEFRLYTNDWRRYEMYRVDRAALLAALADLGVTQVDLGWPD